MFPQELLHHKVRAGGDPTAAAIVLLHGFLGSGRNLNSLAAKLVAAKPQHSVVALTLLGHGQSPPLPEGGGNLQTQAQAVLATLEYLNLAQPWHLFGHSLGGRVALATRAADPQRVGQVMLLDIAPHYPRPTEQGLNAAWEAVLAAPEQAESRQVFRDYFLARDIDRGITDWLLLNLERRDHGMQWRIDRQRLREFYDNSISTNQWPVVEEHAQSLRVIRGGKSNYVDSQAQARLTALGVQVDTVEEAGHFVHAQQLNQLLEMLGAWPA